VARGTIKIAPSILSADFARLGEQVAEAEAAGADYIHVDVMDGHFVPNLTVGPIVVQALRPRTKLPLDVHLMVTEPEQIIAEFAEAGADILTFHAEATPHLLRAVQSIKERGVKAGISLNPSTPVAAIEEMLPFLDLILVMSVNPGFGGQSFIEAVLPKVAKLRRLLDEGGYDAELEVDGGVNEATAPSVVRDGGRVLVAGSAIFNQREPVAEAIARLRASFGDLPDSQSTPQV
jgi:ribulose-phosphate 3-epimerase